MNYRKTIEFVKKARLFVMCIAVVLCTGLLLAQHDPGPRGGAPGAGGAYVGLNADEQAYFQQALEVFNEVDSVSGNIPGEDGKGLGPTFNSNSCDSCHGEPASGGSSPGLNSRINPRPNPQVALATLDGATNVVPAFIRANGPVREARFISTNPDDPFAGLDGGARLSGLDRTAHFFRGVGHERPGHCDLRSPDNGAERRRKLYQNSISRQCHTSEPNQPDCREYREVLSGA